IRAFFPGGAVRKVRGESPGMVLVMYVNQARILQWSCCICGVYHTCADENDPDRQVFHFCVIPSPSTPSSMSIGSPCFTSIFTFLNITPLAFPIRICFSAEIVTFSSVRC